MLTSLGQADASAQKLHATLEQAATADREGRRVLYGDFVEMMTCTEKRRYAEGENIFQEGDLPDGFHLLLSGSCEVLQSEDAERRGATEASGAAAGTGDLPTGGVVGDGGGGGASEAGAGAGGSRGPVRRVGLLSTGDYFGETALLSHAPRNATVRCLGPVEVLRLSREDFEAGFLQEGGKAPDTSSSPSSSAAATAAAAARQTLGFIQMVSCMQRSTLGQGQNAFKEGDKGDRFYIIEEVNGCAFRHAAASF